MRAWSHSGVRIRPERLFRHFRLTKIQSSSFCYFFSTTRKKSSLLSILPSLLSHTLAHEKLTRSLFIFIFFIFYAPELQVFLCFVCFTLITILIFAINYYYSFQTVRLSRDDGDRMRASSSEYTSIDYVGASSRLHRLYFGCLRWTSGAILFLFLDVSS